MPCGERDPKDLSPGELFGALHKHQEELADTFDHRARHRVWQKIMPLQDELRRRWPPATDSLER